MRSHALLAALAALAGSGYTNPLPPSRGYRSAGPGSHEPRVIDVEARERKRAKRKVRGARRYLRWLESQQ